MRRCSNRISWNVALHLIHILKLWRAEARDSLLSSSKVNNFQILAIQKQPRVFESSLPAGPNNPPKIHGMQWTFFFACRETLLITVKLSVKKKHLCQKLSTLPYFLLYAGWMCNVVLERFSSMFYPTSLIFLRICYRCVTSTTILIWSYCYSTSRLFWIHK